MTFEPRIFTSETAPPQEGVPADTIGAWLACFAVAAVTGGALSFANLLRQQPEARMINVFTWFLSTNEPVPLLVGLAALAALTIALLRGRASTARRGATSTLAHAQDISPRTVAVLGLAVCLLTLGITHGVMHAYALTGDEWSATFQARIFASGMIAAPVTAEWRPWAPSMTATYIHYDSTLGTWESVYLPVHALIRSVFVRIGGETLTNPLLAGLTVVGLAGVARRIWPGNGWMQLLAVGSLVTSAQFLLMSGTAYAMPAHLCLNVWWLWCWMRRDESVWYLVLLSVVGVAALGLHQVFPHAAFVAPFLIRLLRERQWGRTLGIGLAYAVGCAGWLVWMRRVDAGSGYPWRSFFGIPDLVLQIQNLALVASWQAPLVAVTALCGVLQARRAPPVLRDLSGGLVLTVMVYSLFRFDQQHGWGYRYVYGVLGNMALMSAFGAHWLGRQLRATDARALCVGSLVLAMALLFPLRVWQAERFVRPFARASAMLGEIRTDVVLVPARSLWYGKDLIRNEPFLDTKPHVMGALETASSPAGPALPPNVAVRVLTADDFLRIGIPFRDMRLARPQQD